MTSNPTAITTDTTAITAVIRNLVSEYETLDRTMTAPARGRRTAAMDQLSAVTFSTVTYELDPYGMDDLTEQVAGETLGWSLFVTDLMVTAMLDFREKAREHHHRPEDYRDRLRDMLLDSWLMALEELKKDADPEVDGGEVPGDAGDATDTDDAGEWGDLAA